MLNELPYDVYLLTFTILFSGAIIVGTYAIIIEEIDSVMKSFRIQQFKLRINVNKIQRINDLLHTVKKLSFFVLCVSLIPVVIGIIYVAYKILA